MTITSVPTTKALDAFVQTVEEQHTLQNHAAAADLIERNLVETWYGFPPERLREILGTLVETGADESGISRMLHTAVSPSNDQPYKTGGHPPRLDKLTFPGSTLMGVAEMAQLRLSGRAGQARRVLDEFDKRDYMIQPLFDKGNGWELVISVQCGITAMLSGDFKRALAYFTEAQLHVHVPTLTFLNRDAYVKAALVHAVFGDREEARSSLEHAKAVPRTNSWTEALIDANAQWVTALLDADSDSAVNTLMAVPMRDIGEMWPFYALILQHVLVRSGRWTELDGRIASLERLPFPKVDGESFPGSVFPFIRSSVAMLQERFDDAQWHLERTDASVPINRLLRAELELHHGAYTRALNDARGLAHEVSGLRQLSMWRYAIMAASYVKIDRPDAALESLNAALEITGQIRVDDLRFFSSEVRTFACQHIENWYLGDVTEAPRSPVRGGGTIARLTEREREIIQQLARDVPRAEIAETLFISLNTLKSHLKKIYRKLGVSTRDAAILRAEREGWC